MRTAALAAGYIACIVLANVLTEHYGLVPVGFGLVATAGTFAAGLTLLARNITQDTTGRVLILGLMAVGVALSWWLSTPQLAAASGVAFALSESADMAVYSPLRRRGFVRTALAACIVGAVVDTFAFLHLAGFPVTASSVAGQLLVKIGLCGAAIAAAGVGRALLRQPVHAEGA